MLLSGATSWSAPTARLTHARTPEGASQGGLSECDEYRFDVIARVTLERAQINTWGMRLDTGEHHLAPTSLAFGPLNGLRLKKNKLRLRHWLLP